MSGGASSGPPTGPVRVHVCAVCDKPIPCVVSGGDPCAPCQECDALQIQTTDEESGAVTARFFCCEAHMYDAVLEDPAL